LTTYRKKLRALALLGKGRTGSLARMNNHALENYLRAHRKKSGLSQRELGLIVGYADEGQVSRHERTRAFPPLIVALSYEAVFRVSVSVLFPGLFGAVRRMIEGNLAAFEQKLGQRSAKGRRASERAQTLVWLTQRRQGSQVAR
jgi:DNA-binding XRE family transcriptional regulator